MPITARRSACSRNSALRRPGAPPSTGSIRSSSKRAGDRPAGQRGAGMRFKSKAQRRKFAERLVKGEITPETYEERNPETGRKEFTERVNRAKKKARRKNAKRKAKTARKAKKR